MPELPEVETIVADIASRVSGRVITGVSFDWEGSIAEPEPASFAERIAGRRITGVSRRGKYIVISLSADLVLLVHLRMTGRLILRDSHEPPERFQRVVIRLDNGRELRFADQRKFGRLNLLPASEVGQLDARLGPEPLSHELTLAAFRGMLNKRRTRLKPLLIDQKFLAGIGNIYADEALFLAGIHPNRSAADLDERESERLYQALRAVLRHSIDDRGTTMSDYLDGLGRAGRHQEQLNVYRRTGLPCPRCGSKIERLRFGGRGTHYCPRCQQWVEKVS